MKVLEALTATSEEVRRCQIRFSETTGLIDAVGDLGIPADKVDYFFGNDCLLFAGLGDIHIHAREDISGKNNYKEDFCSAHAAMVNGGVTHAGDMPNNPIPPIDDESYAAKLSLAAEKAHGDIWTYAGIGPSTRPLSYRVPYKVYMGPSVGELFFKDLETLDETLKHYQGQWVSFHCEDPEILEENKNAGEHHLRRPIKAEAVATRDAIHLIEKYKLNGKLCHYSSEEGLNLVREARLRGVTIHLEVTPQHLCFDVNELSEKERAFFQMNPPIRFEKDKKAMLEALKNGEIEYLATDHAPHTKEEKQKGTSGLTGLDTFGPFVTWLIQEGMDPKLVARVAAENPGDFYNKFLDSWKNISPVFKNFGSGLGHLKPHYRANFTVLNLKKPFVLKEEDLKTKVGHSPFLGFHFPGQVEAVFIGGQKV